MIAALLAALLALVGPAQAFPSLSAPFGDAHYGYYYPTAYYDHGGVDWACGSIRYSGHRGNDFGVGSWSGMDAGRDIVAAADGTVVYTNDGEYDRCSSGTCAGGSGCGNYVKIRHDDGTYALYCHMRKWTVAVSYGQRVRCGTKLGQVGSSGNSTGPHLHFEPRNSSNVGVDPFRGSCHGGSSLWISQGSHGGRPAKQCGPRDRDGDGYDEDRDCNDNNRDIHPGAEEICDNGVDENCDGTDAASGTWWEDEDGDGWGDKAVTRCGGQPAGTVDKPGDCDDGRAHVHPEAPELCDSLDNDCDTEIDEGGPTDLGPEPPVLAARIVDWSVPSMLAPGASGEVWVMVDNVGTASWARGGLWLQAVEADAVSPLHDAAGWAAWDVLGVLDAAVPSGGTGVVRGTVRVPEDATGRVQASFRLANAGGDLVKCPAPEVEFDVVVGRPRETAAAAALPTRDATQPTGCSATGAIAGGWLLSLLGLLRRRRC